jgi:hypothetical protein
MFALLVTAIGAAFFAAGSVADVFFMAGAAVAVGVTGGACMKRTLRSVAIIIGDAPWNCESVDPDLGR